MDRKLELAVKAIFGLVGVVVVILIVVMLIIPTIFPKADTRYGGIPELTYYVTDEQYVLLEYEYNTIAENCYYVDEQTSCEMAVLIVNDTGDRDINDFALRTFQKNELGKEGKDNGVLIVLVLSTREWKVEVGYGLTYVLTTAYISDVGRNNVTPMLQAGDYGGAMIDMTYYLGTKIIDDYEEAEEGDPAYPIEGIPLEWWHWVILIVVVGLIIGTKGQILLLLLAVIGGGGRGGFGGGRSGGGGAKGRF